MKIYRSLIDAGSRETTAKKIDARLKTAEEPFCEHPQCYVDAACSCDQCNRHFCSDHGTRGGDRQVQDVGLVAYPSLCWACGGFDADASLASEEESDLEMERRLA